VTIVGIVVLSFVALVLFRLVRHGSLPGIELASTDVGALSDEELAEAVEELEEDRAGASVTLRRPASGAARDATVETTGVELGYIVDVDATVERVLTRGRQGNPFAALADQIVATFSTIEVDPVDSFAAEEGAQRIAAELSSPPFYGGVRFSATEVEARYPKPGVVVSARDVTDAVADAVRAPGDDTVTLRGRAIDPSTDESDVDDLVAQAERAVDGPVRLTLRGEGLTFSPEDIAGAIKTTRSGTGEAISLGLTIPPKSVNELVGDDLDVFETTPQDATFELSGSTVRVVPDKPGFKLVPKVTARQLLQVALKEGAGQAAIKGRKERAEFTTADARALNIDEQVSTFTTYHSCCEPRVENIHRIADIVDGAVVEPGDSFSLNDFVGPRTTANGFVPAPAIRDGEFVEEVGGGISQFATTTFNAIFFGGYDLLEYKAHSYYISRYPPGREATISTPSPDLAFLNDSNAGVYIDTSYTDTSITVSFFGKQPFEVTAHEGPRKNVTPPEEQCRENKDLAPGEESVVQEGLTGFDIVVTRDFSSGHDDETFSTHYNMQPRIVEKRKCPKKKN
jgi:vancomycin resistance protein YoaR